MVLVSAATFQSTHPCGVRHVVAREFTKRTGVSIHAPLRGATGLAGLEVVQSDVSIHAPLRGATHLQPPPVAQHQSFNPRTPAGCDPRATISMLLPPRFQSTHPCGVRRICWAGPSSSFLVSIHAPLRGATLTTNTFQAVIVSFNPRTPAGCDLIARCTERGISSFNPRTPAGCDLSA